jgi:hypothetical protein
VRPRRSSDVVGRPLNFTVRGQPMRKQLLFAGACLGLLCAYGYALTLVEGYAAALPIPPRWIALFPSRVVGLLSLSVLYDTVALLLVSLPVAVLLARFGGRRATAVALIMTTALFVVTTVPSLIEDISRGALAGFHTPWRLYMVFAFLEFIAVLPLLVWFLRKLPSNNRWRGP